MRSRNALLIAGIFGLVSACERDRSMIVETPPADTIITHSMSIDWIVDRMDSTIVYIDGVRADSQAFADLDMANVEAIHTFEGSAAVERYGAVAEGRIVKEYTLKPKVNRPK